MEQAISLLEKSIKEAIQSLYQVNYSEVLQIQKTRKEFEGDLTLVTFPLLKTSKKTPELTGEDIGKYLVEHSKIVSSYNVVKGFLNVSFTDSFWIDKLFEIQKNASYGIAAPNSKETVVLEYSSPNTNKPLHLGHVRNILLGYSMSQILKANGNKVLKVQVINDRGIHICKSMYAWKVFGNGETPENTGIKGDKLVGKYYVEFDKQYKREIEEFVQKGKAKEDGEKNAPSILAAQEMLRKWEAGDKEVVELWSMMNGWVYKGFDVTYNRMGVDFDKLYYESNTYLEGKKYVEEGLSKGVFTKRDDGSVWCDLTADGLDEKLVLRADGTAVYITQDIGTAILRYKDFPDTSKMIYTVGNEQDYHFKVLFLILAKLGFAWAKECYHLSYGMVDLPSGKMKSREGTVVDADDLMDEMEATAKAKVEELGKVDDFTLEEREQLYHIIGMAALKYFILKVDAKKRMMFNPEESVDFNGNTGPFIQYTHARISSILRKAGATELKKEAKKLEAAEKEVIKMISEFPQVIKEAASLYNPALIANYVYELVKTYNFFYQTHSVLKVDDEATLHLRLALSSSTKNVVKTSMNLLGIDVPERM